MLIYIVTSGEYSSYRIEGVFSTEAKARTYAGHYGGRQIEEYEVDELPESPRSHGRFEWDVTFDDAGTITAITLTGSIGDLSMTSQRDALGYLHIYTLATREETARRIAVDKRTEYLAAEQGIT